MWKHWASKATGMSKIGLDGEPHAETTFLSQSFEQGKNDSWQFHYRREAYKQNKETVNTARPRGQKNSWLYTCMLKAGLAYNRSAARCRNAKNIRSNLKSNISDQEPKNSQNEFCELKRLEGTFGASWAPRNAENKPWAIQSAFLSQGPGSAKNEPQDRPSEMSKMNFRSL